MLESGAAPSGIPDSGNGGPSYDNILQMAQKSLMCVYVHSYGKELISKNKKSLTVEESSGEMALPI